MMIKDLIEDDRIQMMLDDMKARGIKERERREAQAKQREINKVKVAQLNKEHEDFLAKQPKMTPAQIDKIKADANAEWEYNHKHHLSNE